MKAALETGSRTPTTVTQVDFYVLSGGGNEARERFACRLAEKAWRLRHRIHLHVSDDVSALRMDELLWTFRDGSFVPHEITPRGDAIAPVTIGYDRYVPQHPDLLINLDTELPPFAGEFARIAEIVAADPERRRASRRLYKHYRDNGYAVASHAID